MLKSQKGITLVALVITIIILIILAAVTIGTILPEGGIFNTAKKAANDYNAAAQNEQNLVNSLDEYVNSAVNGTNP